MTKIKVITNKESFAELASKFEGSRSAWAQFQNEFIHVYLPSAIHHYLQDGSLPAINKARTTAVVTRALSTFGKLVDPFACSPFDKDAGKFVSVNAFANANQLNGQEKAALTLKFKQKRKRLLKLDKGTNSPNWLVSYTKRLKSLEKSNAAAKHRTFDQDLMSLVKRVVSLANSEDGQKSEELQRLADVAHEIQPALEAKSA